MTQRIGNIVKKQIQENVSYRDRVMEVLVKMWLVMKYISEKSKIEINSIKKDYYSEMESQKNKKKEIIGRGEE